MVKTLKFGQKIKVSCRLKRQHPDGRVTYRGIYFKEPRSGIYLGERTVSDGILPRDGEYNPSHYYRVALVCLSPRENPFYTFFSDIKEILSKTTSNSDIS